MRRIDVFYRALISLRRELAEDKAEIRLADQLRKAAGKEKTDHITGVYQRCKIDEAWIEKIEAGLPYVENAINGSYHAARREGGMFGTANEKRDFLYENRFLYMLLVFLKTFVNSRYKTILTALGQEHFEVSISKKIDDSNRRVSFSLNYTEDGCLDEVSQKIPDGEKASINRIRMLLEKITDLLSTPMMSSMAALECLTPPVVMTDNLKENPDFQEAYRLFSFIMDYQNDGYEIIEEEKEIAPPDKESCEEIAALLSMISLISREAGYDCREELRKAYLREEEERYEKNLMTQEEELRSRRAECGLLKEQLAAESKRTRTQREKAEEIKAKGLEERSKITAEYEERIREVIKKAEEDKQKELDRQEKKFEEINTVLRGEIRALRIRAGLDQPEDFTEEEAFFTLSEEKKAFDGFYMKATSKFKKQLQKEILWKAVKEAGKKDAAESEE